MKAIYLAGVAALALGLGSTTAVAQTSGVPAEYPPASFTGNQYVDSKGCAFIRAGVSGAVDWVARVNRDREQLCSFQPTFAQSAPAATAPVARPAAPIIVTAPAAVPTAPAVQAPAVVVRVPAQVGANPGAPIQTVASLTTPPRLNRPAPAASPRVVTAPVPAPVVAPARPTVTLAQACAGKFGVQRGFVSARTGEPIDCGPAPAPVVAAAPAVVVPAAPVAAAPLRLTLAEVCDTARRTGQKFVNAETGESIVCAAPTVTVAAVVPRAPAAPAAPAAPTLQAPAQAVLAEGCPRVSSVGQAYLMRGTGLPLRCYPQAQVPYAKATPQMTRRATAPLFGATEVPASNPRVLQAETIRPPAGYRPVWDDGRLNPQRGLPRAAVVQEPVARVSSRSVPQAAVAPAALTHRYVQVGSFGDPANAQRTTQQFQAMGLPVATQRTSGGLQVIAIGPFGSADDLQRALQAARSAGFGDAFLRN